MTEINIKGMIVSDENAEVYSWFGYNTANPSSVADQLAEIPDDDAEKLQTVGEAVEYIKNHQN